jgi:hypothetical protein
MARGMPNSVASLKESVVQLCGTTSAMLVTYVLTEHPYGNPDSPDYDRTAPLWPNRALDGARRCGCRAVAPMDYAEPVDPGAF